MKRDKTLQLIARIVVWFEELAYEIKARRFAIISEKIRREMADTEARRKATKVDYVQVKIINELGNVVSQWKEFRDPVTGEVLTEANYFRRGSTIVR